MKVSYVGTEPLQRESYAPTIRCVCGREASWLTSGPNDKTPRGWYCGGRKGCRTFHDLPRKPEPNMEAIKVPVELPPLEPKTQEPKQGLWRKLKGWLSKFTSKKNIV